jgi:hypothetical protein
LAANVSISIIRLLAERPHFFAALGYLLVVDGITTFESIALVLVVLLGIGSGSGIVLARAQIAVLKQVFDLTRKFKHCWIARVSDEEYLGALSAAAPEIQTQDLRAKLQHTLGPRFGAGFLNLFHLERKSKDIKTQPLLSGHKAFQVPGMRAYVFFATDPRRMSGLGLFQSLHEIGHVQGHNGYYALPPDIIRPAGCVVLILLLTNPTSISLSLVTAVAALELIQYLAHRHARSVHVVEDEIYADTFAVQQCSVNWVRAYDPRVLAAALCATDRGQLEYKHQSWLPIVQSDEQRRLRQIALIRNLTIKCAGEAVVLHGFAHRLSRTPNWVMTICAILSSTTSFATCYLFASDESLAPVFALCIAMFIAWVLAYAFVWSCQGYVSEKLDAAAQHRREA